jgi:glycosyltransferase involved in cell wall biosynthesis
VTKIHYHSDLNYFGGCENMIANFLNSRVMTEKYEMSFSFRDSSIYREGLSARLSSEVRLHPLKLPIFSIYKKGNPSARSTFVKFADYFIYLLEYIPIVLADFIRLQKLFKRISPDILHINNGGYPGALSCRVSVLAAKFAGIKNIVFVVNNMAANYSHPYRWIDLPLDAFVAKNVNYFISGSKTAINRLQQILRLKENQLRNFPNGISVRKATETISETRIRLGLESFEGSIFGVIGVMEPRKGHIHLLESILEFSAKKRQRFPSLIILIEGEGGVRPSLEQYVRLNGLEDIVRFIGVENQIYNLISLIDVLIYPSIQDEDFPNIISEAMSLSKAVISTKVSGATDQIVDGETGILVERTSKQQLAEAIAKLALNPALRDAMGEKARARYLNNYTSELALDNYVTLYESMLGK